MKAHLLASAAILMAAPAFAGDWTVEPWSAEFDNITLSAGGVAQGTIFTDSAPKAGGLSQHWATGAADFNFKIERMYDSGLQLALKTSFELAHDRLSSDNYGGDLIQKVYGVAQTGLGRVEIGMTDGAAYQLSITGPVVDDATSLDNANATFFVDPSTGRAFTEVFTLNSALESSSNYAKLSYFTPRILGVQLGVSYTPSEGKEVIPFLNQGPNVANRQKSIWETALSYSETFDQLSVGAYAAAAFGHGERKTPGHAGLTDWSIGTELDYEFNEDTKLAVGGGWRHANLFAFDIYDARTTGGTQSSHLSTTLTYGPWIVGGEYSNGTADGGAGGTVIGVRGLEASVGYVFNTNLQLTAGWQQLTYDRNAGSFYNGAPRIEMNAAFLHLKFKV